MAFSFGGTGTPAPASAASAGSGAGFIFGGAPTAAPTAAPGGAGQAAGGFSFGGGAPAAAPATGSFSLGGASAPATAAGLSVQAPASGGGFSFGQNNAGAPASAAPASTPVVGGGFGGAAGTPVPGGTAAPGNASSAAPTMAVTLTIPEYEILFPWTTFANKLETMLDSSSSLSSGDAQQLHGEALYQFLMTCPMPSSPVSAGASSNAATTLFKDWLKKPDPMAFSSTINPQEQHQLRDKLRTQPHILLHGKLTSVPPPIYAEVINLSDQLKISLTEAIALYGYVSGNLQYVTENLSQGGGSNINDNHSPLFAQAKAAAAATLQMVNPSSASSTGDNNSTRSRSSESSSKSAQDLASIPCLAREWYFYELSRLLSSSVQTLLDKRWEVINRCASEGSNDGLEEVDASEDPLVLATDELLSQDSSRSTTGSTSLFTNMMNLIDSYTTRINSTMNEIQQSARQASIATTASAAAAPPAPSLWGAPPPAPAPMIQPPSSKISSSPTMAQITQHMHRYFYLSQRRQLCGMLYLAAHDTQLSGSEIVQLLELIQNLSNNYLDRLLDPMLDVPSLISNNTSGSASSTDPQQHQLQPPSVSQPGQPLGSPARTSSRTSSQYENGIKTKVEFDRELMLQMHLSGRVSMQACVNTLVLAALCAMDTSAWLWDRQQHNFAIFGQGNALMPPVNVPVESNKSGELLLLHKPLFDNVDAWKRQDILGLLRSAYALLLSPLVSLEIGFMSDEAGADDAAKQSSRSTSATRYYYDSFFENGIEAALTSILPSATDTNAIRWIRTGLLPFVVPSSVSSSGSTFDGSGASTSSFAGMKTYYCATVAQFLSRYASAAAMTKDLPITRAQWAEEQESEMDMARREEQHRQLGRQFFGEGDDEAQGSDGIAAGAASKNFSVDYAKRPDCLEDLLMCIADVIMAYPACAMMFWIVSPPSPASPTPGVVAVEGQERQDTVPTSNNTFPTRAPAPSLDASLTLLEVERLTKVDGTVVPSYLNLLSALALATFSSSVVHMTSTVPGAQAVHGLFSSSIANSDGPNATAAGIVTWAYLLECLQWYATQMTASSSSSSNGPQFQDAMSSARGYYYGDDNNTSNNTYYNYGRNNDGSATAANSAGANSNNNNGNDSDNSAQRAEDTAALASLLNLFIAVCRGCPEAREVLLAQKQFSSGLGSSTTTTLRNNTNNRVDNNASNNGSSQQQGASSSSSPPSILYTLFSMLLSSADSSVKSLVFSLLAVLVQGDKNNNTNIGNHVWEIMEEFQIVPIVALSDPWGNAASNGSYSTPSSRFNSKVRICGGGARFNFVGSFHNGSHFSPFAVHFFSCCRITS
jgi:hypothetical protein